MSRTFTRAELRTELDNQAFIANDGSISTTEKDAILNRALAKTWDVICDCGLGEKYVKSVSFNTVANQTEYPFATVAPAGDLYRIHQLYADEGNQQFRALQRIQPAEILNYRAPTTVVPLKLYYIPSAPIIATGAGNDSVTFDGVNGWEEHTLACAVIEVKNKKQDDASPWERRRVQAEQRIQSMGNIDFGEPARVVRKRGRPGTNYYPYFSQINAYVVRGDKIELYYQYPWVR
jgi:hypothetical protein